MADRGALSAIQNAQAVPQGVFAHVMEPTAAFPGELTAQDASPVVVDLEAYQHPFDGPAGASDFTDQFTVDRTGTGYFMQPADDTQDALQGLANGRSQVAAVLIADMGLESEVAAGSTTVAGAPSLSIPISGSSTGSAETSNPTLARLFYLDASPVGTGATSAPVLGLMGGYRLAVLASGPAYFMHLDEPSGNNFFDDPDLGGELIGTTSAVQSSTQLVARRQQSLVETAFPGSTRHGALNITTGNLPAVIAMTEAAAPPTLDYSVEFWFQATDQPTQIYSARTQLGRLDVGTTGAQGGRVRAFRSAPDNTSTAPGAVTTVGATRVLDNKVHHIVVTYEAVGNGVLTVYVDGVLDGQQEALAPPGASDPGTAWVAAPAWRNVRDGYGFYLDEPAYYTSVLTEAEVAAHYRAAFFTLAVSGAAAGSSLLQPADLAYADAELLELQGSATGLTVVQGALYDGATMELVGSAAGTADLSAELRHMRLNMSQAVTTPRGRVRFVRAKV